MASAWLIALAIVLVVLAGLLVSAETAIGRVSRSRIEELRKDKQKPADRLLVLLDDRARYINVLLFLSTLATVAATVITGYVIVDILALVTSGPLGQRYSLRSQSWLLFHMWHLELLPALWVDSMLIASRWHRQELSVG